MTISNAIHEFLNFEPVEAHISYDVQETTHFDGYTRQRILYTAPDGDQIPAYLLSPDSDKDNAYSYDLLGRKQSTEQFRSLITFHASEFATFGQEAIVAS
jgi:hypothetical protein